MIAKRLIVYRFQGESFIQTYWCMIRREAKLAHSNGRTLNADQTQGSFSYKHYFKARGATRAEISRSEKKAKEKPFKDEEWEEHFRNYLMDSTNRQLLDRILQAKLPAVKLQYDRDKVRAWTVEKTEPSIFLKIESKHRQVISSKFPKSFRGAGDLVVLGNF